MSRAERLLALLDALRRHRQPIAARRLAEELGVSLRTVYRDIQSLIAQGATIDGEAGIGFVLQPGFLLPPLMFRDVELEALALGAQWVRARADPTMARAAADALARIGAVLPASRRDQLEESGLLAGPTPAPLTHAADLTIVRAAMRAQTKLALHYATPDGVHSERVVWPIGLAFFEQVRVVIAWCELRNDFRSFRADRIAQLSDTGVAYRPNRRVLLKRWREREGISS